MTEALPNFEGLLREALAPVEPPEDLVERLESTLTSITEMAADELEAWELSAMRDPRNWARPAAALVAGGAAGTALVLLRARRRGHGSPGGVSGVSWPSFDRLGGRAHHPGSRARDAQAARRPLSPATADRPLTGRTPPDPSRSRDRLLPAHGHLLSPPLARDGRLLLELRPADLPRLHDHDPGRHALPGVLQAGHESDAHARHGRRAARHLRADRDQRHRVPDRAGPVLAVRVEHPRPRHQRRRALSGPRSPKATSTGG